LATVEKLKEFGVKNVVILGPSPHWTDDLPKLVFNAWRKTLPRTIPDRLAEGLMKPETRAVDQQLAHIPGVDTFHYVSVLQQMCDGDGCLTHVPGHSGQLITWDSGHLTTEGAVFLSRQLLNAGVFTTH
jgi:hypothetical protein